LLFERFTRFLRDRHDRRHFTLQQGSQIQQQETPRRSHSRRHTHFHTRPVLSDRQRKLLTWLGLIVSAGVFIFSAYSLINYGVDYLQARRASNELRNLYYAEITATPDLTEAPVTPSPVPTATPTAAHVSAVTPVPTTAPNVRLDPVRYPSNPFSGVTSRFQKIQRQNKDIIGWLTIKDLIDLAVVQRDNSYYLRRDYRGYRNDNGAIFLDESISLKTRPYTLMLYGHNMKTGLMFGSLRNYENVSFYKRNPFITFDTAYEDGRYVIFAVTTISTVSSDKHFVNLSALNSTSVALRQQAIASLSSLSVIRTGIDVQAQDQVLLLITCTDDDDDRRVVAARRIRDGESEKSLETQVQKARAK